MSAAGLGSERIRLLSICLLALTFNFGYVVGMEPWLAVESDAAAYDQGGWDLARGFGFPTRGLQPKREPGIYAFFGSIYFLFGHDHSVVRVIQALLTASLPLLTFILSRRLASVGALPRQAPLVAAALAAVYPPFLFYSGVLMREASITFLALVSLVCLTGHATTGRLSQAAWYGAFAGLGALVDGRFLFFAPFVSVVFLVSGRGLGRSLQFGVLSTTVALAVISPWTIRNYIVLDKFVLLSTAQYKGLWLVTNPQGIEEWDWEREPLRSLRDLPADQRDQEISELAIQNLRDYPGRYIRSSLGRFVRLWWGGSHSDVMPLLKRPLLPALTTGDWGYSVVKLTLLGISYTYVFGGFLGALWVVSRAGFAPVAHLIAFPAYLSILHMILYSSPRYHIPAAPVLIVFFSGGLVHVVERLSLRRALAKARERGRRDLRKALGDPAARESNL
ncbi:MAG: glycosyltransferase family 39 protein [Vicinamibacterales bacterium]|nr:glycosyltransferase family 39 protein [Vicinamibacterales bacterium]